MAKRTEKRKTVGITLVLLLSLVLVIVPSIGLASANSKGAFLEKVDYQIEVFENVIHNSNNAGIDAKKLDSIVSKMKKERDSSNNSMSKKSISKLSDEFNDELHNIRELQDKQDVERAIRISEKQMNRSDSAIRKLESHGIKKQGSETQLGAMKSHYDKGKKLYQSGDYKVAEEELRKARKKYSELMGDLGRDLEVIYSGLG